MLIKNFENVLFYNENDANWIKKLTIIVLILYCLTTLLFFLVGALEINLQSILAGVILIFWIVFTTIIFKFAHDSEFLKENFRWCYIPAVLILAIIEETIIYYNGGGLGGKAKSLEHDLLLAVPVFVGIAVGIYLINLDLIKRYLS
ncbi:MAG: hypothetical protein ACFFAO_01675 [Candidatus Hermodarchaeota archaeon]